MSYGQDLVRAILGVKNKAEARMPEIRSEIEEIIAKKDESVKRIEHLLNQLLDFTRIGMGEEEFNRLNEYYATVNNTNAQEYMVFYQDVLKS